MELLRKRFALDLQTFAIITLVLGNLAQAFSDVLVKLIGPGFSPFQYMFLRQLLTLLVLLPFMLRVPRSAWGLGAWKWHLLRGHLCLLGGGGMMLALTQLPLATANAIFYVSPLLTLPLAAWLLKEKINSRVWLLGGMGLLGVVFVLKPGDFHLAGLGALVTAFTLALFNVTGRKLPAGISVVATLFWANLLALPLTVGLAVNQWQPVDWHLLALIGGSGVMQLLYHASCIYAYRQVEVNRIAATEYSGLMFVVLMGILLFGEIPAWNLWVGVSFILLAIHWQRRLR
ncbi:DMT family transporter [Aeromonas salmonicida]|uniref:DMT family transporter n=1 Tax=Aeromonas salmonicida TaxID=645 RepID=UPI0024A8E5E6|nr:DMT family transporter [Aeromonas salmonicida]MDM5136597.1 DMT family transporter [Aeromonas salmonicida]WHF41010.1 DMT family transporter [Aeromonas salmonicida]